MAVLMPAWQRITPSYDEPGILIQINQFSGAFAALADGKPRVRLNEGDLMAYIKTLSMRTRVAAQQSSSVNQIPSNDIIGGVIGTGTYLVRNRAEFDHHDTAAAANYNVPIVEAFRLAGRQGIFQNQRDILLYGMNPARGEGLLNSPNSTQVTLPADPYGNTTVSTYDNGAMVVFLLTQIQALLTRTYQLGIERTFVILGPQQDLGAWEIQNIVELVQYQRLGAGSATVAGVVKEVMKQSGHNIMWCYDDTLIGKGAGGTDAIIIVMPEISQPIGDMPDTNEFGKLPNGLYANTLMYTDMAAPREIMAPLPAGAVDMTLELRSSSGWLIRPESLSVLSMAH